MKDKLIKVVIHVPASDIDFSAEVLKDDGDRHNEAGYDVHVQDLQIAGLANLDYEIIEYDDEAIDEEAVRRWNEI